MVHPAKQRSRHLGPGDKLGKYELIRQIAVGGMAELYLARTLGIEGFEKLVVVKRILPQYVATQSFVDMFLNEARIAATLHHPNVAQVYDIGVEDGEYFFAMEYVHGEDLERIASSAHEQGVPISLDVALTLGAGLCAGLHYAHEKVGTEGKPLGIVHRDVSPSNVLVSYDGAVKLVDFGIARATTRPSNTQSGLKGKIAYMSPEQCRSKSEIDRRSDLFSVGSLLYELTTGQPPFTAETEYQVLDQIVNVDAPPPSKLVPSYPIALERIVLRALARDPDRRYATAVELQADLEDFAHESRLRVSPLVLARLMSSLFPARLEEWDSAKAQGAFFVEQHVVRTLIESGRTPDPLDPAVQVVIAAAEAQRVKAEQATKPDEDTTAVTRPLIDLGADTSVGPPVTDTGVPTQIPGSGYTAPPAPRKLSTPPPGALRMPTSPPTRMPTPVPSAGRMPTRPARPPTPLPLVPDMPGAVPIVGSPAAAPEPVGGKIDLTERVQVVAPRAGSDTRFVHAGRRRTTVVVIAATIVIAAAIATFLAMRTGDHAAVAPPPEIAVPARAPPPEAVRPVEPKPEPVTPVEPVAMPAAEPEVKLEPPKEAEHRPARKVHVPPKNRVAPKPPKSEPKPPEPPKPTEPKESKPWNADSPFMPVRTDKH